MNVPLPSADDTFHVSRLIQLPKRWQRDGENLVFARTNSLSLDITRLKFASAFRTHSLPFVCHFCSIHVEAEFA